MTIFVTYLFVIPHGKRFVAAVVIFNLLEPGNVLKALRGERIGTLVDQTGGMA